MYIGSWFSFGENLCRMEEGRKGGREEGRMEVYLHRRLGRWQTPFSVRQEKREKTRLVFLAYVTWVSRTAECDM